MAINLFNAELVMLFLAFVPLILQSYHWIFGKNKSHTKKYDIIFSSQPCMVGLYMLGTYFIINHLNIPTINLSFLSNSKIYNLMLTHLFEVIRFILVIFLLIKEEKIFYLWFKAWDKHSLITLIMLKIRPSFRFTIFVCFFYVLLPEFTFFPKFEFIAQKLFYITLVWSCSWIICQAVGIYEYIIFDKVLSEDTAEFKLRSIATRASIIKKMLVLLMILISIAITCLFFDKTKTLGTTIFASAGVIAGITGFALKSAIENFLIGVQIAFSQPIKINDTVEIEGQLGTVEEITLNYATIKLWDYRRLIVPIKYFINNQFLNLSRSSTNIISSIYFAIDDSIPVEALRAEFIRFVNNSQYWDRNSVNLQVVDIKLDVIYYRGIISTQNPSDAWNIKCEILEKIHVYITANYPNSFNKFRIYNHYN